MKTRCPECGYEGNIKDELIPEEGRTVGCPQCKAAFTVKRDNSVTETDAQGGAHREVEVNGKDFIPFRERETRVIRQRTDRLVTRIAVLSLAFAAVFVIGLFIGRFTHNYTLTNPLKKKETAPAGPTKPTSPITRGTETTPPSVVPAAPGETPDTDTTPPSEPTINEENFTSDVFLDITEIDGKLNEATDVTGLQRELDLTEYAGGLVGKTLVGYFIVKDVGKLNSSYAKKLPLSLYGYYIEAEADSADTVKSVVYVGLKQADDLSSSLDKASRVFIQGYIYSCLFVSDHFELGVVNSKVESSR